MTLRTSRDVNCVEQTKMNEKTFFITEKIDFENFENLKILKIL